MLYVENTIAKGEGFYWTAPDGGASVSIDGNTARYLKDLVLDGFHALPKRGAEVGGILVGHVNSKHPLAVRVDAIEPLPCEYRFGPSFVLSENDRARMEDILARLNSKGHAVVGYYRSCTGRALGLDAADAELLRAYFPKPDQVFLTLQPLPSRECLAWVSGWRNGQLSTDPAQASVPFDVAPALQSFEEQSEPDPEPTLQLEPEPQSEPEPQPAPTLYLEPPASKPAVREPRPLDRAGEPRLWPWVFALIFLVVAGAFFYQLSMSAPRQPRAPLSLDVKRTSDGIQVNWNRSVVARENPQRGVLSITEGGKEENIHMDAAEIARGTYFHKASAEDVLIRLTVDAGDDAPLTESFRLVADKTLSAQAPPPAPEPAPVKEPEPVPIKEPERAAPKEPEPPPVRPAPSLEPAQPAVPPTPVHRIQPVVPEGIRNRISTQIVLPVIVEINAAGRVTRAVTSKGSDGLTRYLGERATEAARGWRFRPARSKAGEPVPSTTTLYFSFKR
jgi:hypothetical protein